MKEIKIVYFMLSSFFAIESPIIAEKTTVTVHPESQEIEIIQDNLFTITATEEETNQVLKHWDKLFYWKEKATPWASELEHFPSKQLSFSTVDKTIQPHLKLSYSNEKALSAFGIWYDKEQNEFSINNIPPENIKTKNGKLDGNYWVFNGNASFSFTLEPLLDLPEEYKKLKKPLDLLLKKE